MCKGVELKFHDYVRMSDKNKVILFFLPGNDKKLLIAERLLNGN